MFPEVLATVYDAEGPFAEVVEHLKNTLWPYVGVDVGVGEADQVTVVKDGEKQTIPWAKGISPDDFVTRVLRVCQAAPVYAPGGTKVTSGPAKGGLMVDAGVVHQLVRNTGCDMQVRCRVSEYACVPMKTLAAWLDGPKALACLGDKKCVNLSVAAYDEIVNGKGVPSAGLVVNHAGEMRLALLVKGLEGGVAVEFVNLPKDNGLDASTVARSRLEMYKLGHSWAIF